MATPTLTGGPVALGGGLKVATFDVEMDSSYPTGGEAIDISDYFDYVFGISICGNDTLADNAKLYQAVLPGSSTAVTDSNVLISVFWSADGTDGEDFVEFTDTGNLSAVGALSITVYGK